MAKREVIDLTDSPRKPVGKRTFPAEAHVKQAHQRRELLLSADSWQPFYLNSLPWLSKEERSRSVSLTDLLQQEPGNTLQHVLLMNYMVDLHWLVDQAPHLLDCDTLLLHGSHVEGNSFQSDRWVVAKVDMRMEQYGTHHSKAGLLFYPTGVRVFITTANFIPDDWNCKTQGTWVQDFPRKTSACGPSVFESDLVAYLSTIHTTARAETRLRQCISALQEFDFRSAEVKLLASVPGRHRDMRKSQWGLGRLIGILAENDLLLSCERDNMHRRLCLQFSSLGSMGKDAKLIGDYAQRMLWRSTAKISSASIVQRVDIVWPTVETVRQSVEGYAAGDSLCCGAKNMLNISTQTRLTRPLFAHVQAGLKSTLCQWQGRFQRERAMPHMKCYFAYESDPQDCEKILWFALTSCNLSQAAWGVFQTNDSQLYIKSYELGVVFVPALLKTTHRQFSCTPTHHVLGCRPSRQQDAMDSSTIVFHSRSETSNDHQSHRTAVDFPIPFKVPAIRYGNRDEPWIWDIPFPEPDSLGNSRGV